MWPGHGYDQFTDAQREAVIAAFPRETDFKRGIVDAFYQGMKHRPDSTIGTFNGDVLAFRASARKGRKAKPRASG